MLAPTLYILAFFLGISVLMGILLAVHDGIEYLVNRRNAALAAARVLGGQGFAAGPARRDLRQFVVVSTSQQPEQGGVGSASRELPSWFESASRDVMVQPSALHYRAFPARASNARGGRRAHRGAHRAGSAMDKRAER
mgnify:FL=1